MPKKTLTQGVWPVAAQAEVTTLLTTTPGADNCYLNRVMERTDLKGDPLLPILRFGTPCADCMLTNAPWRCKHNTGELPPWKSADKQNEFTMFYEEDMDDFNKEQLAMSSQQNNMGFQTNDIAAFKLLPRIRLTKRPPLLCIAADAAAGGSCEFAIAAGYIIDEHLVVSHASMLLLSSSSPPPPPPLVPRSNRSIAASIRVACEREGVATAWRSSRRFSASRLLRWMVLLLPLPLPLPPLRGHDVFSTFGALSRSIVRMSL